MTNLNINWPFLNIFFFFGAFMCGYWFHIISSSRYL